MNPTTPEERRAYAARKNAEWRYSPAGRRAHKRRQIRLRRELFNPDWMVKPGRRKWTFSEDVAILRRDLSDRELAKKFATKIPGLRQRRVRLNRLLHAAQLHAGLASDQILYYRRLMKALKK